MGLGQSIYRPTDATIPAMTFKISGFGDEISDELTVQLRVLRDLGVDALEPRRVQLPGAESKNIVDLSDAELHRMRGMLDDYGIACSQIGSPVGKAPLGSDLAEQRRKLEGAIRAARALNTRFIRVFGFQPVRGLPQAGDRPAAIADFCRLVEHAALQDEQIVLSLENEHDLYDDSPDACAEFLRAGGATVTMCFDPGNFVRAGIRPFDQAWPVLGSSTRMLHVKDCLGDGHVWVPAGEGDGQVGEILEAADPETVTYLSLEPHLAGSSYRKNASPDREALWRTAHSSLAGLLEGV